MDMSQKRTFRSFRQFWQELLFILKNYKQIKSAVRYSDISSAFRERLMLAVTAPDVLKSCVIQYTYIRLSNRR